MKKKSEQQAHANRALRSDQPVSKKAPRLKAASKTAVDAAAMRASGIEASRRIDEKIQESGDWRGKTLERVRQIILGVDPEIIEELKWMGTPVWSREGIICTGETYKQVVKLTFARGASLDDPRALFNSSLEGNTRRAIDIREGDSIDARGLKDLIRAAIAENLRVRASKSETRPKSRPNATSHPKATPATKAASAKKSKVVLLSGGNPQIAKADGDAPVQTYIAAMPGWKRDVGKRLDTIIERHVPKVLKAVKWNSPFYGVEGQGWFLAIHCYTKFIKVAFFKGALLRPVPPGESSQKEVRYLNIHENDNIDEAQLGVWIQQAASLPGWLAK